METVTRKTMMNARISRRFALRLAVLNGRSLMPCCIVVGLTASRKIVPACNLQTGYRPAKDEEITKLKIEYANQFRIGGRKITRDISRR